MNAELVRTRVMRQIETTRFDALADPLWRAIAEGRTDDVARLQAEMRDYIEAHPRREAQPMTD